MDEETQKQKIKERLVKAIAESVKRVESREATVIDKEHEQENQCRCEGHGHHKYDCKCKDVEVVDKMLTKVCIMCGEEFQTHYTNGKYCSEFCRSKRQPTKDMIIKTCVKCGKEFETTKTNAKYCSRECSGTYYIEAQYEKVCERCGKTFTAKRGSAKYCPDCSKKRDTFIQHYKICEICGKPFYTYKINTRFCSKQCAYEYRRVKKTCVVCGNEFWGIKSSRYCSTHCRNKFKYMKDKERKEIIDKGHTIKEHCMICTMCGRAYLGHLNTIYCPECKKKKNKSYAFRQCKRCGTIYRKRDNDNGLCVKCKNTKKCKVCGNYFEYRKDKTIICQNCKKEYGLASADQMPNTCAWCGKYIREHKAVCEECYRKNPRMFDLNLVDCKENRRYMRNVDSKTKKDN